MMLLEYAPGFTGSTGAGTASSNDATGTTRVTG